MSILITLEKLIELSTIKMCNACGKEHAPLRLCDPNSIEIDQDKIDVIIDWRKDTTI